MVDALVLAEPAFQPTAVLTLGAATALVTMYVRRWLLRREKQAAIGMYRWITSYKDEGNRLDDAPAPLRDTAVAHARAALREMDQLVVPWPSVRALASIRCPTVLLVADASRPLFRRASARVARALPSSRQAAIANSSHFIAFDQPAALAKAVASVTGAADDSASVRVMGRA